MFLKVMFKINIILVNKFLFLEYLSLSIQFLGILIVFHMADLRWPRF